MTNIEIIQNKLISMQDLEYKKFHQKLVPTEDKDLLIGIRVPILKKYAKELIQNRLYADFILGLPHRYYEENMLHGLIISEIKDYKRVVEELDKFLPYVTNWAVCDSIRPKVFKKNKEELIIKIEEWLKSDYTYTVRFGIEMLMCYYLDEDFKEDYLYKVASIKSNEYYINMMIAWYMATAIAKQNKPTMELLNKHMLSPDVQNKTIQKAIESFRVSDEDKNKLRKLKVR